MAESSSTHIFNPDKLWHLLMQESNPGPSPTSPHLLSLGPHSVSRTKDTLEGLGTSGLRLTLGEGLLLHEQGLTARALSHHSTPGSNLASEGFPPTGRKWVRFCPSCLGLALQPRGRPAVVVLKLPISNFWGQQGPISNQSSESSNTQYRQKQNHWACQAPRGLTQPSHSGTPPLPGSRW